MIPTANIEDMQNWAHSIMCAREPDYVIGENYLLRWWVLPRNEHSNVYLHEFRRSDEDRALHDHPWPNRSVLLRGRYMEHTPAGSFLRVKGDVVDRPAEALHRIELIEGEGWPISLFITGPKVREWGFACPNGWVHWRDFVGGEDGNLVGKGCGE